MIDYGAGGYNYQNFGAHYKNFSPINNIRKGAPPTIIFIGTNEYLIPVKTEEYYQLVMNKVGNRRDVKMYDKQDHGFFNYTYFEYSKRTVAGADAFLQSLGYLAEAPKIKFE